MICKWCVVLAAQADITTQGRPHVSSAARLRDGGDHCEYSCVDRALELRVFRLKISFADGSKNGASGHGASNEAPGKRDHEHTNGRVDNNGYDTATDDGSKMHGLLCGAGRAVACLLGILQACERAIARLPIPTLHIRIIYPQTGDRPDDGIVGTVSLGLLLELEVRYLRQSGGRIDEIYAENRLRPKDQWQRNHQERRNPHNWPAQKSRDSPHRSDTHFLRPLVVVKPSNEVSLSLRQSSVRCASSLNTTMPNTVTATCKFVTTSVLLPMLSMLLV